MRHRKQTMNAFGFGVILLLIVQQNEDRLITMNRWRNNHFSPYSCCSCSRFF